MEQNKENLDQAMDLERLFAGDSLPVEVPEELDAELYQRLLAADQWKTEKIKPSRCDKHSCRAIYEEDGLRKRAARPFCYYLVGAEV